LKAIFEREILVARSETSGDLALFSLATGEK